MSKLAQATSKYIVYARFEADGTVEKPDVIGAVFGQTEGLLGPDMDLRELQRTGRVGRIDVEIKNEDGKTSGIITIPSSLDASQTSLIAACMETIERIGPSNSKVSVEKIDDVRSQKREYVVDRAKELLGMFTKDLPEPQELSEQIRESVRSSEIIDFKGLPAGPNIEISNDVILVEGRADVVNLLKHGVKNVIGMNGTSIPDQIVDLSKEKTITAFLDGDRGGDLILKELMSKTEIDSVTRAPRGKEVEELTKKEIFKSLRDKIPADQSLEVREEKRPRKFIRIDKDKKEKLKTVLDELVGTRASYFLDENMEIIGRVPVKEMFNTMRRVNAKFLVFDGDIDQKLIDYGSQHGIKYIVGMKKGRVKIPERIKVLTIRNLKG